MALISILVPAKNEASSIINTLEEIAKKVKVPYEIIVINDSSTDKTEKIVSGYLKKNKKVKLINTTKKLTGFSNALHLGFTKSKGFAVVPVMGDLCDDPETINIMYKKIIKEDWDVVCGSRYIKGGEKSGGPKLQGIFSNFVCVFLNSLGVPTYDATNAFKMYKRSVLKKLNFNPKSGVELSMELVLQAHFLKNAKITDIPTVWRGRTSGKSKFKFLERAPRYANICLWALFNSLKK